MPTFACPATWPIEATEGDLIPAYARPQHQCVLPADHVRKAVDPYRIDLDGHSAPAVEPHRCHCGSWSPVRDEGQGR